MRSQLSSLVPKPTLAKWPPETEDVVLYRTKSGERASNVPMISRQEILAGPYDNWGYSGTGPHALGSDILQWFGLKPEQARHWAAELVIEYLDFIPRDGARIPKEQIEAIVREIKSGSRVHFSESGDAIERMQINKARFQGKGGF
ncbi:MAG: hypothetical protein ACXWOH_07250 [Bdellovibrionota bacterium]